MASKVFDMIAKEQWRQEKNVELIASENFVSDDILKAMGSCLTNKYCEGYPGHRYYGGCQYIDEIEIYCQQKWQQAFHTDYHVNVQPHSGSQANFAAYSAVCEPGGTILALDLQHGGHLTHGSKVNFSGKLFNFIFYNIDEDGFIDYEDLANKISLYAPRIVLAGASAYSREIDFKRIRNYIDEISKVDYMTKPYFIVDMAHIAGLVAAGEHQSPFGLADIITTTTHKTLRGPRGGMIFCKPELAHAVDSAIFPGSQGGPLEHVIAAKAIAAEEACTPEFKQYIRRVKANADAMARTFISLGYNVITGGTDNHMFLIDLTKTGLTGKEVQEYLDEHQITVNKNCIPCETRSPFETSGIRIGTAAMTTKGYEEEDFIATAIYIHELIQKLAKKKEKE